jgi:hypothetical protein
VPRKPKSPKPLYKQKLPSAGRAALPRRPNKKADQQVSPTEKDFIHAHPISTAPFELREDGSVQVNGHAPTVEQIKTPPPKLAYSSDTPFVRLYQGNCLELLDAIYAIRQQLQVLRDAKLLIHVGSGVWRLP